MKIVNGKLLGQPESDLEIFKERQNQCNLELTISLEKLEHRIKQAETTLQGEALREALFRRLEDYVRQLEERCQLLEQEQKQLKTRQQQWKYLEDAKISQIENNLIKIKQQNPQNFLWLTFGSSVIVGIISLCNWFNIYPTNIKPKEAQYSLISFSLIESDNFQNNQI
jgi:hypothetical protein